MRCTRADAFQAQSRPMLSESPVCPAAHKWHPSRCTPQSAELATPPFPLLQLAACDMSVLVTQREACFGNIIPPAATGATPAGTTAPAASSNPGAAGSAAAGGSTDAMPVTASGGSLTGGGELQSTTTQAAGEPLNTPAATPASGTSGTSGTDALATGASMLTQRPSLPGSPPNSAEALTVRGPVLTVLGLLLLSVLFDR